MFFPKAKLNQHHGLLQAIIIFSWFLALWERLAPPYTNFIFPCHFIKNARTIPGSGENAGAAFSGGIGCPKLRLQECRSSGMPCMAVGSPILLDGNFGGE